jgi:hypothetical protein
MDEIITTHQTTPKMQSFKNSYTNEQMEKFAVFLRIRPLLEGLNFLILLLLF